MYDDNNNNDNSIRNVIYEIKMHYGMDSKYSVM